MQLMNIDIRNKDAVTAISLIREVHPSQCQSSELPDRSRRRELSDMKDMNNSRHAKLD